MDAPCCTHKSDKGRCDIPTDCRGPTQLAAGWSCKTYSRLFNERKQFRQCLIRKLGSSGVTVHG
eukprot:8712369-Alexandrium_andersonii.AAC.1